MTQTPPDSPSDTAKDKAAASRPLSPDERADKIVGIPWIYVSRTEAHAHPKGQLGPLEWAIACYFLLSAGVGAWLTLSMGGTPLGALGLAIWPVLAGLGLMGRVPWAHVLAVAAAGLALYRLVTNLGPMVAGWESTLYLVDLLIYTGILFHLMDGERPNLIYRHRYRKYSVLGDE